MDIVDLLRAFYGRPSREPLQTLSRAFPTPIPSSSLAPTPGPDPYQYIRDPQTGQLVRAGLPNIDPRGGQAIASMIQPSDVFGGMVGHAITPAGRTILGSEIGAVGRQPRIVMSDLEDALGAYQPASQQVFLNRAATKGLSAAERAAVVRHEFAHKIETESKLWQKTDTYLWDLWERNPRHPIFDYMGEKTGLMRFNNEQSPEIIAHLYAEDYPNKTFMAFSPEKGENVTHPIPQPLLDVLDKIEGKLGIWTKKISRGTAQ